MTIRHSITGVIHRSMVLLRETRLRLRLILSSIFAATFAVTKILFVEYFGNYKLLWDGNFKINRYIAFDMLYTSTGNDVTGYFQSAANRIKLFILGHVWS